MKIYQMQQQSNAAAYEQIKTRCTMVTDFIFSVKVKSKIQISLIKEDKTPEKISDNNAHATAAGTGPVTFDNSNGIPTFNYPEPGSVKGMHRTEL